MVSIRIDGDTAKLFALNKYFDDYNLENIEIAEKYKNRKFYLKDVLRLDYGKT